MMQDGKFLFINSNAASYAGYTREELLGQEAELLVSIADREKIKKNARAMLKGELTIPYEFRIITKQGETRWIMETLTSIFYEGKPAILGNSMDITERKQAEENLQRSEERYRTILENIEDGYFEVDIKGSMTFCNPSTARIIGYTQEELIGMNNRQYMDGENARKVFSIFNTVHRTGIPTNNFAWELIRKGGEKLIVEASVSLIRDTEGKPVGFRGICRNITERKRMEEEIREMSIRDQLTELYNRRGFIALADQQIKTANRAKRQMMLSFIDVDNMKWINDTLGHEEGDKALIDTANILRQTLRESDIIARMGGDEFAVLAIEMTDLDPEVLSKRLQQNMDDWNAKESRPYKLAMSWGTAIYDPESPMSLDRLISLSDELMYTQKKAKICRRI
jgi:diguanylate cyclase (GGDEF)-like protein/PAS domain S-box-containing protein